MAHVHAARPDVRWIIAGGDSIWDHSDYVAAFDARVRELPARFAARVTRTGTVLEEDLAALYGASDVLLCASELEGFGLAVLEAMAAGTPVVAPDRAPFTEYLDERSALLVDGRSPAALGDAVLRLLCDDALRGRLVDQAGRSAAAFTWARSADAHAALLPRPRRLPDGALHPHQLRKPAPDALENAFHGRVAERRTRGPLFSFLRHRRAPRGGAGLPGRRVRRPRGAGPPHGVRARRGALRLRLQLGPRPARPHRGDRDGRRAHLPRRPRQSPRLRQAPARATPAPRRTTPTRITASSSSAPDRRASRSATA